MPAAPLSRRAFLRASAGAVVGAAAAAATASAGGALVPARKQITPRVTSSDLHAAPGLQRVAFVTYRGARPVSKGPARLLLAPPGSDRFTAYDAERYTNGLPAGRGIYVTSAALPTAGIWTALAEVQGERIRFPLQVKPAAEAPAIGAVAPAGPSPTTTATMGVDPICTRRPKCPLHDVSLSDVIGKQPVAVMFATPALCQTQYCGPVLDELLDVMGPYQQRGVQMVHVEIYESTRGATVAPTVEAWNLPSEPWLFTIDANGVIRDRLDGAFATDEVRAALDRLAA